MTSTSLPLPVSFLPNYALPTDSSPTPLQQFDAQYSVASARAGGAAQSAILAQLAALPSLAATPPVPAHQPASEQVPTRGLSMPMRDDRSSIAIGSGPDVGRSASTSALDIVQSIMKLATRKPKVDIPLLASEHYHVNPVPQWESPVVARPAASQQYSCAGCAHLQAALSTAAAKAASLESNQLRILRALTASETSSSLAAVDGGDAEAMIALLESRKATLIGTESKPKKIEAVTGGSISADNLMETLAHVNARLTQLEADLEVSVSEMQKVEANVMKTLESVHQSSVPRSEFAALATEWSQAQRSDALELYHDLLSAMGVSMASVQQAAGNPRDLNTIEAMWRSSHVGRSLAFLQPHDARTKRSASANAPSTVAADHLGGTTATPALDSVGVMPLYTRMLGVLLVDEPFAPGVRVREVLPHSNGAASGLRGGDYLTSVNRIPVRTCQDMIRALTMVMPGSVVKLRRLAAGGRSPEDIVEITAGSRRVPLS